MIAPQAISITSNAASPIAADVHALRALTPLRTAIHAVLHFLVREPET